MNIGRIGAVTAGQIQKKIDTISDNIANVNTTGFKRREATFSDLLHQQMNNQTDVRNEVGRLTPYGLRVGYGAKVAQTAIRLEQGPVIPTDRELDFAITEKNHFFRVEQDGEAVLTRDGTFYLTHDPDNEQLLTIVNSAGNYLLDGGFGRFTVPLNVQSLTLSETGELSATLDDGTIEQLGQLALTNVHKPQLLDPLGGNLFRLPDAAALGYVDEDIFEEVPADEGRIIQGTIEGSNVDMSREMSELINAQRHYQFMTRAISIADDMSNIVNGMRR